MKRSRKKLFGLILLLIMVLCIAPKAAYADNSSGGGTGTGGDGHAGSEGGNYDYTWNGDEGQHYVKITAYTYSGAPGERPTRISDSHIFTNLSNSILFSKKVNHAVNQPSDKLSYLEGNAALNVQYSVPNMTYLDFKDLGSDAFKTWFIEHIIDPDDNNEIRTVNNALGLTEEKLKKIKNGYYYVVESMAYVKCGYACNKGQLHFFGTSYEMAAYNRKNTGSYPTIQTWVGTALYLTTQQSPDPNRFVGNIFKQLNPSTQVNNRNCNGCSKLKVDELMNYNGYGLNIFWKEYQNYECHKEFNSNFPVDPNTHEVLPVVLNSDDSDDATIATSQDIAEGNAINCCSALLQSEEFGNDKQKLCDERPECCYDCDPGKNRKEENPSVCTTSTTGAYQDAGNDKDTWYCMKAFDQYSPYKKTDISYNGINYARVVCRESLIVDFPKQLRQQQSVGTYMVWPTSSELVSNNNKYVFSGTMTCKLSIDKAEIEASGNANDIYNYIYEQSKSFANSNTAASWYNLNPDSNIRLTYNDDEYGGVYLNLVKDETTTNVDLFDNGDSNWYKRLNSLTITIDKTISYKLPPDAYMKLTTSGIGSSNLSNMFDELNKNQFVTPRFGYSILPISYKAKPSRNITVNKNDYYRLTIKYSKIGDKGQYATSEKDYTCPYEVTFAPPTNEEDNPEYDPDDPTHDDNNDSYDLINGCICADGSAYAGMSLNGYLIKNNGMTCAEAQGLYCNGGRGHMNVEYRVISLTEPFPGINGNPYINGGRKIGYNWRDTWDNPYAGEVVKNVIINNRGTTGYDVYNKTPLYRIELDSATIKAIRDYNKTTNYADFTLTCRDSKGYGKRCISNFLRGTGDGVGNLLTGGTCANATSYDNFYSCADKADPGSDE